MFGGVHPRWCVHSSHDRELSDLPTCRDFGVVLPEEVQASETRVYSVRALRNNHPQPHTGDIAVLLHGIPPAHLPRSEVIPSRRVHEGARIYPSRPPNRCISKLHALHVYYHRSLVLDLFFDFPCHATIDLRSINRVD